MTDMEKEFFAKAGSTREPAQGVNWFGIAWRIGWGFGLAQVCIGFLLGLLYIILVAHH